MHSLLWFAYPVSQSKEEAGSIRPPLPGGSRKQRAALPLLVVGLGSRGVAAVLAGSGGGALPRPWGGGCGGGDDHRRAGIDLEDAEAEDSVGDLQVVVERVEQVAGSLEPHPAVVRLGAVIDLVGHLAQAPAVLV